VRALLALTASEVARPIDTIVPPAPHHTLRYRRILLKLSGEALCGVDGGFGIRPETLQLVASELAEVHRLGVQIGIVVGGGNIFRGLKGASALGMDRALERTTWACWRRSSTALALQDALEKAAVPTRVVTGPRDPPGRRALHPPPRPSPPGKGPYVVILAAGTGNPYFTTDTAAALRAMEIQAQALFKATKVEGIYERDPVKYGDARMYTKLSYDQFLAERIGVMDATAVTLCRENKMPIRVFKLSDRGNIMRVCQGEQLGTVVVEG
jgi:uridylate kinase